MRSMLGHVVKAVRMLLKELSKEKIVIEKAYLFGSYAKGSWIKTSDVDLILVSRDFEGMPFTKRLDLINKVQWKAGISPFIEAIPLTPQEFKERVHQSVVLRDASKYWVELAVS